jgi:predicted alpha-1,2-mannosidase
MVFNLIPFTGSKDKEVPAAFTYDNESITPYCYKVNLDEQDIDLKFAPAGKSGFFTLHFGEGQDHGVILKTRNKGELINSGNSISGFDSFSNIKIYLYLEFDKETEISKLPGNNTETEQVSSSGDNTAIFVKIRNNNISDLNIRYGISYISIDQAKKNLNESIKGWEFAAVSDNAKKVWNSALSKIETEGGSEDQKTMFYTSLYRCYERMIDVTEDGKYFSIWSNRVEQANDTSFFTDDWVWDTHLALHPLQVILNPGQQDEKITSYIRMARQSGWMPTFPTPAGDMHAMNGNHSAAVILDAWNKGIRSFNLGEAYDHLKNTILNETKIPWIKGEATWLDRFYDKNGYFPGLRNGEAETLPVVGPFEKRQSVAVTLASSYDDWCMAQMAKELGKEEDYNFFTKRSLNYRNLFNSETGFYHPKDSAGKWIEPFDYRFDSGIGARDYYDENNAWTYIWQPNHAYEDLIRMMGGKAKLENKLDQLFSEGLGRTKWIYYSTFPDATGNVGQYVMGNEPSMHIPYLYNLAGTPWKTQKRVRMLMDTWFRNDLMGIPGDEDGGGLSAFYVFSAMGFYPITPGIPGYQIGSPIFSKVKIHLQNGKTFTVVAENCSKINKYIQSAKLNGTGLMKPVFTHNDIFEGGILTLEMGDTPNRLWGSVRSE